MSNLVHAALHLQMVAAFLASKTNSCNISRSFRIFNEDRANAKQMADLLDFPKLKKANLVSKTCQRPTPALRTEAFVAGEPLPGCSKTCLGGFTPSLRKTRACSPGPGRPPAGTGPGSPGPANTARPSSVFTPPPISSFHEEAPRAD